MVCLHPQSPWLRLAWGKKKTRCNKKRCLKPCDQLSRSPCCSPSSSTSPDLPRSSSAQPSRVWPLLTFKGFKRSFHNPDSGYFSAPFLSFHGATASSLGSERARNLQKMHLGLMSPSLGPRVSEYPTPKAAAPEVSVQSPRGQLGETRLLRVSEEGEAGSRWEQAPGQHPENNQKRG